MKNLLVFFFILVCASTAAQNKRPRDYGIEIGILKPGKLNAITDVEGVLVGHTTVIDGNNVRTGVTAIVPHNGNIFLEKVPAAIYIGNGFGKLTGYSQVEELGNIETPIILTNTLSVPVASNALITYTLSRDKNMNIQSVNPIVGETNDGYLNDIRGRHITEQHVIAAIKNATGGPVAEGNVGAGTGTICFGYKGGIGTSSRVLPESLGGYTVGVLVQTNFGGVLQINGVPVGVELKNYPYRQQIDKEADGSCMMVVVTDAPVGALSLKRIAKRAIMGLARTGGIASNGSGDYVIAISTNAGLRIPFNSESPFYKTEILRDENLSPLFLATIEATEEAIINSLFGATTMTGRDGHKTVALPVDEVLVIIEKYNRIKQD